MVAALSHATGVVPAATGKPDPAMHAESVQRSKASHPIVVGDRLDTDIEGARRADCPSLLVLTGVTDARQLLRAGELHRPDYLGADVSALLIAHPELSSRPDRVCCGPALVEIEDRTLVLHVHEEAAVPAAEAGDGLDPLRALAVAGWQLVDRGQPLERLKAADPAAKSALDRFGLPDGAV
jgi:hypothetical protein